MIVTSIWETSALLLCLFVKCFEREIFKLQLTPYVGQQGFGSLIGIIRVIIHTVCL